jgi:pimeloyl-ACP methyl ester carboxylesterase
MHCIKDYMHILYSGKITEEPAEKKVFDKIYKDVPTQLKNHLARFRSTHPLKKLKRGGVYWKYIVCGKGERTLLLIPGSWHVADIWFKNIIEFESEYHIISVTYPGVTTMGQLVDGVVEILESESIDNADILGHSFGGMIAQCLVRTYPAKARSLILSNTDFPHVPKERKRKIRLSYLLPEKLFLLTLKKTYFKLIEPLHPQEREFWQAYFEELYSNRITKNEFMGFLKCALDFHKNYSFTRDDLEKWPGDVLLLESDNDQYFPASQRKALKALYPQAEMYTFHHGGHTPSITKRDEFNSVVKTFLKGHAIKSAKNNK